jgi:hypothetical protein
MTRQESRAFNRGPNAGSLYLPFPRTLYACCQVRRQVLDVKGAYGLGWLLTCPRNSVTRLILAGEVYDGNLCGSRGPRSFNLARLAMVILREALGVRNSCDITNLLYGTAVRLFLLLARQYSIVMPQTYAILSTSPAERILSRSDPRTS